MNSISVEGLSLRIGGSMILNRVSADISGHGVIVLFGPNGAGKSTLLKAITGLVQPDEGRVTINGYAIDRQREDALSQIGAHIEPGSFYPHLSAREVLEFIEKIRSKSVDSSLTSNGIIEKLGMSKYADTPISTYSTGMKRLLAVASAAVCAPNIILLDEPTDGLDPVATRKVSELISYLDKEVGSLIIITSHDIEQAESIATRKLILMNGEIMFDSLSSSDNLVLKVNVSNPEGLKPDLLAGLKYELRQNTLAVMDLKREELSRVIQAVSGVLKIQSVSVGSQFRQFYESYIEKNGKVLEK